MNIPKSLLSTCGVLLGVARIFASFDSPENPAVSGADPLPLIVAPPVVSPRMEFVVIRTEKADYLQSEFSGLPVGSGVVLDSLVVRRQERTTYEVGVTLEVHWRWSVSGRDSLFPAVRRVQYLDSLALPRQFAPVSSIVRMVANIDTLRTCNEGRCQAAPAPKVVRNYESRWLVCAIACSDPDSTELADLVKDRIRSKGLALALRPSATPTPRFGLDWVRTDGSEDLPSLVSRLPGNAGNWLSRSRTGFDILPLAYPSGVKTSIPERLEYQLGPASYIYDRSANPNLEVMEDRDVRVVDDTLVKFGRSLQLSGNTKIQCGRAINDTDARKDSWLVVPDSVDAASIDRALTPGFCGNRASAWRFSGDSVWLGRDKWPVLVTDLLPISSLRRPQVVDGGVVAPRLVGTRLVLPFEATVVARNPGGSLLGGISRFSPGEHRLEVPGGRGVFLLEVRGVDGRSSWILPGTVVAK